MGGRRRKLIVDAVGTTYFMLLLILGVIFMPDVDTKVIIALFAAIVALAAIWSWCDLIKRWREEEK